MAHVPCPTSSGESAWRPMLFKAWIPAFAGMTAKLWFSHSVDKLLPQQSDGNQGAVV